MVEVEPERAPLEFLGLHDALLIQLAGAQGEAVVVVASRHADLVVDLRAFAQNEVLPVGPAPGAERRESPVAPEQRLIGGIAHGDATRTLVLIAGAVRLPLVLGELRAGKHAHPAHLLLDAGVGVVRDRGLPALALTGGDEHHAVRAARAVDRRRRRVLQNLHRLDVVRVEVSDPSGHRDPVQHVQRVVGRRQGPLTAHPDADAVPGLVACRDDVHARHPALDRLDRVHLGDRRHGAAGHGGHGSRHVLATLRAVPDDDDVLECDGQRLQREIDRHGLAACHDDIGNFGERVPDEPGPQPVCPARHERDRVTAVGPGVGAELSAENAHAGGRERRSRPFRGYDTRDRARFGRGTGPGALGASGLDGRQGEQREEWKNREGPRSDPRGCGGRTDTSQPGCGGLTATPPHETLPLRGNPVSIRVRKGRALYVTPVTT